MGGESAPSGHAESAGMEHLSGGAGEISPIFRPFRNGSRLGGRQNLHEAFDSSESMADRLYRE